MPEYIQTFLQPQIGPFEETFLKFEVVTLANHTIIDRRGGNISLHFRRNSLRRFSISDTAQRIFCIAVI